jgi:hypothetical protein
MKMQFENPANGYIEEVDGAWFYSLLFGCFYFAYKGAWMAAILVFIGSFFTVGLAWLLAPIYADDILRKSYLQKGWKEVTPTAVNANPRKPKPRGADHERKLADARKKMGW